MLAPDLSREQIARAGESYRERQERDRARQMTEYAETSKCRWKTLVGYFGGNGVPDEGGVRPV